MKGHPERACVNANVANSNSVRIRSATADILIGLALAIVIAFSVVGQSPTGRTGPLDSPLRLLGIQTGGAIGTASFAPWRIWTAGNGYRNASLARLTAPAPATSRTNDRRSAYMLMGLLFTVLIAANVAFLGYLGCTYAPSRRTRCGGAGETGPAEGMDRSGNSPYSTFNR